MIHTEYIHIYIAIIDSAIHRIDGPTSGMKNRSKNNILYVGKV